MPRSGACAAHSRIKRSAKCSPVATLTQERRRKQCFQQPLTDEDQQAVLETMRYPRSVATFSDSGAHVPQTVDYSLQIHLSGAGDLGRAYAVIEPRNVLQAPTSAAGAAEPI